MILPSSLITVTSFSLVIFASLIASNHKLFQRSILLIGLAVLTVVWLEFTNYLSFPLSLTRMYFSLFLFLLLFIILIRNVLQTKIIHLKIIVNVMSGFILLGIVGGVCFEILDYFAPNSLSFTTPKSAYSFYYFSFINLTSVGFGDITPNSPQAQATTVILGVLGQFYLAFGVSVFIGKYLSQQNRETENF